MKVLKSCAIFLVLTVLLMPSYIVPAAENPDIGKEVIVNGGFEELKDGIPAGEWYAYHGWEEGFVTLEETKPYEGKYSISIEKEAGTVDLPWYRYLLTDFTPGALYEASLMANYNLESGEGGSFMILVESYSGDKPDEGGTYITGKTAKSVTGNTNEQWVEMRGTVQIPENAKLVVVYCYLTSPGKVKVDNVSFKMSGGPEPYFFSTDQVFYYPEDRQGVSHVEIDSYYKPEDEPYTATVDFELADGETILSSAKDVRFHENGRAEFVFDLSFLAEQEKMYSVNAVLKKADGTVRNEYTSEVYIYPRPTALREDGVVLDENGKPFYPSIAYWPLEDYAKMKEVGVNVAEISAPNPESTLEKLDRLQAAGMKGLVSLFAGPAWMQPAGHPQNIATTQAVVEAVKDHPAVFAWCLCDEPLGSGLKPDRIRDMITSYKIVREIDKHHPTYVLDYNPALYKESQKYGDLWTVDIYTYGDTSAVSNSGRLAVEAAAGRKPTYYIGMTYKANAYGLPNITDVRGGLYRAFESGVTGIGYYTLAKAIGQVGGETPVDLPDTPLWEPMKKFAANEQQELFDYFAEKKYPTFNLQDDGELRSFYYTSWVHGKDIWVIAHNRGNETIEASVPLVSSNGLIRVNGAVAKAVGGTDTDLAIEGSTLNVTMKPQEVYLYKVTPSSAVNFEALSVQVEKPDDSRTGVFTDLGGYDWAREAIEEMYGAGIVNDTTVYSYSPEKNITRGDFAMYLMRALGLTAAGEGFADVPDDAVYAKEVTTGKALGILQGTGDNLFEPEAEISRQDMMKIAARAMRYAKKLKDTENLAILDSFIDKAAIADYATADVAAMVEAGIILGNSDSTINPGGRTTRAEAAVIMSRIIKAPAVETPPAEEDAGEEEEKPIVFARETVSEAQAAARIQAMDMLKKLGIADIQDGEAAVIRGEAAKLLVRMLGFTGDMAPRETGFSDGGADNAYSGYIAAANQMGIMRGLSDETFGTLQPITYTQMVKVLVDALGYSAHAENLGGYPSGYLAMGSQLGITKGLSVEGDGALRGAAAALLAQNALSAPVAQRRTFGTDSLEFIIDDNITMLSAYHGITERTGKVTGTSMAVIESSRRLQAGEVALGQDILEAGDSGAENYLGQQVTLYTKKGESDLPVILYVKGRKNTETLNIPAEYLLPGMSSMSVLYYRDADYKEYRRSLESGAQLVYNGKAKAGWTINDLEIEEGSVTLLSDGGSVNVIIAEEYSNHVIDKISTTEGILYFTDGTSLKVDTGDSAKRISFMNLAGKNLTVEDCKEGSVVSVTQSEDGSILRLVLSSTKVSGKIAEIDNTECVIGGKTYQIAANLRHPAAGIDKPELGMDTTFILDKSGKIAAVDMSGNTPNYGYFTGIEKEKGLNGNVTLRIFSSAGKMEYLPLAKRVEFNDGFLSREEVADSNKAGALYTLSGVAKSQLVIYDVNDNGEIYRLKTAKSSTLMTEEQRLSEFTKDVDTGTTSLSRWTAYDQQSFGDYYRYNSSTVMFNVPDKYMDEKYYSLTDKSKMTDMGWLYNSTFYDIDENLVIGAVVTVAASATTAVAPKWGSKSVVVTDIRNAVNEDGDTILGIGIYDSSGKQSVLYVEEDFEAVLGVEAFTTETVGGKKPETIFARDLKPGDVISYETNDLTGMARAMRVLLRANTPAVNEKSQEYVSEYYNYSQCTRIYGTVLSVLDTGLLIQGASYKRLYVWKARGVQVPIYLCERGADGQTAKFTAISKADIRVGDKVFCVAISVWNQFFVIYR